MALRAEGRYDSGYETHALDRPVPALFSRLSVVGLPTSLIALRFLAPTPGPPAAESMGAWFAYVTTSLRPRRSLSWACLRAFSAS